MGFDLVVLERARAELSNASIQEVRKLRDTAQAAHHYAMCAGLPRELQDQAAEIKLRSERQLGRLLSTMDRCGPGEYPRIETSHGDTFAPSLKELGISRSQSSCWRLIASLPDGLFETYIEKAKGTPGAFTTAGVLGLARRARARQAAHESPNLPTGARVAEDLHALAGAGEPLGCIHADPPWRYENHATRGAAGNHYPTMCLDEIASLPVADLAAENAHLHLWVTNSFLLEAEYIMQSWGFSYRSNFVWVKPQIGLGNYWRSAHELLLLGVRGSAPFLDHSLRSWTEEPRRAHSEKPEAIRSAIEQVSPGPFLELFARRVEPGWTAWGNQVSEASASADKLRSERGQ